MASIDSSRVSTPPISAIICESRARSSSSASNHFAKLRSLITPTVCQRPLSRNAETLSSIGISLAVLADRRQLHRPPEPRGMVGSLNKGEQLAGNLACSRLGTRRSSRRSSSTSSRVKSKGAFRRIIPVGDASLVIGYDDRVECRLSDAPEFLLRGPDLIGDPGLSMQLPPEQQDARQAEYHDADRQPFLAGDSVEPLSGVDLDAYHRCTISCMSAEGQKLQKSRCRERRDGGPRTRLVLMSKSDRISSGLWPSSLHAASDPGPHSPSSPGNGRCPLALKDVDPALPLMNRLDGTKLLVNPGELLIGGFLRLILKPSNPLRARSRWPANRPVPEGLSSSRRLSMSRTWKTNKTPPRSAATSRKIIRKANRLSIARHLKTGFLVFAAPGTGFSGDRSAGVHRQRTTRRTFKRKLVHNHLDRKENPRGRAWQSASAEKIFDHTPEFRLEAIDRSQRLRVNR